MSQYTKFYPSDIKIEDILDTHMKTHSNTNTDAMATQIVTLNPSSIRLTCMKYGTITSISTISTMFRKNDSNNKLYQL